MINFYKAQQIVLEKSNETTTERVRLTQSLERFLAEDIISPINIPPHSNSALDGFVFRHSSVATGNPPFILNIIDEVQAGASSDCEIKHNEAVRIMTGAPIPNSGECVIGVEDTEILNNNRVKILKSTPLGANIRLAGEDITKNQTVLSKGTKVTASVLGVLASLGLSYVSVYQKPLIGIIATGNEILEPGDAYNGSSIYSSNSYTLQALIKESGAIPVYYGIAKDTEAELIKAITSLFRCDIIVTTGGVSMGKYDLVKSTFLKLGMKQFFWKVAVKPGKPLLFGMLDKTLIFGLPGNPVSTVTSFLNFVKPAILKMFNASKISSPLIEAVCEEEINKKPGRLNLIKGQYVVKDGHFFVLPLHGQGSGILSTLAIANCIIMIPEETTKVLKHEKVLIRLLEY